MTVHYKDSGNLKVHFKTHSTHTHLGVKIIRNSRSSVFLAGYKILSWPNCTHEIRTLGMDGIENEGGSHIAPVVIPLHCMKTRVQSLVTHTQTKSIILCSLKSKGIVWLPNLSKRKKKEIKLR